MVKGLSKKNMKCNKYYPSSRKGKKEMVKVCKGGVEKLIHFGAKGYSDYLKHKDYERMLNFRARHKCDTDPANVFTPKFHACERLWPKKRLK